jgi:hypothetical protein
MSTISSAAKETNPARVIRRPEAVLREQRLKTIRTVKETRKSRHVGLLIHDVQTKNKRYLDCVAALTAFGLPKNIARETVAYGVHRFFQHKASHSPVFSELPGVFNYLTTGQPRVVPTQKVWRP